MLEMLWVGMVNAVETPRDARIGNYSIFHGLTLFGYSETDDVEQTIDYLSRSEVNQR